MTQSPKFMYDINTVGWPTRSNHAPQTGTRNASTATQEAQGARSTGTQKQLRGSRRATFNMKPQLIRQIFMFFAALSLSILLHYETSALWGCLKPTNVYRITVSLFGGQEEKYLQSVFNNTEVSKSKRKSRLVMTELNVVLFFNEPCGPQKAI